MAGKVINMSKVKQIIRLKENGVGLRAISKSMGISRNTVKKYLQLIEDKGYTFEALLTKQEEELEGVLSSPDQASQIRYEDLEKAFPHIEKELNRTGVNRWILWGEYKEKYPGGYSYPHFCMYLRQWMGTKKATMHFEHTPADKMFIDFAGKKLHWVDPTTGEVNTVEMYVAILGYSQLTYAQAVPSQKKGDFIAATENALHYFGGVPQVLVPDNLKSAVHKADKYEADLNADFSDFANHYNTSVLPARSFKPRDKSLVENAVSIVYSRIYAPLRDQVFHSLQALNAAVSDQLEIHNNKPFQKTPQSRRERFLAEESDKLKPLAQDRYEMKRFKFVTVMKNCHIILSDDKHYYSIPYRFIGRKVKMVYSHSQVSVYYNKERIAFHKRDAKYFGYTTMKDHLPSAHQFVADWNPDKFLSWAARIDPKVTHYISMILEAKTYPEQAYRSCVGILSQEKKVGRKRLIDAIERAVHYGAYNYKIIQRILAGGLDRLKEDDGQQMQLPFHENIRGPESFR
ncbi:MAG TPA: IS21 family transposase [Candidatus Limnocylindrales bacterium]|nr:IS21 family transposase [Candidatus Limnocylindrales bacterium]